MLRTVASNEQSGVSEGEMQAEQVVQQMPKKTGRPSNAEKIAKTAAQLAAGNITQAQVDATLPPALARVVKSVAKVSAEEFTTMLRGEYELLAKRVIHKAGEEVENLKGFTAFLALGVVHDKLMGTAPNSGITHQTNIQINGVDSGRAAAIAGRFATHSVPASRAERRVERIDVLGCDDTFPILGGQTEASGEPSLASASPSPL